MRTKGLHILLLILVPGFLFLNPSAVTGISETRTTETEVLAEEFVNTSSKQSVSTSKKTFRFSIKSSSPSRNHVVKRHIPVNRIPVIVPIPRYLFIRSILI